MSMTVTSRRLGYQLKRTQHALRLRMDEALHALGLTAPQYAVLSILEEAPRLSNADLARRSFVTTPASLKPACPTSVVSSSRKRMRPSGESNAGWSRGSLGMNGR